MQPVSNEQRGKIAFVYVVDGIHFGRSRQAQETGIEMRVRGPR
jgi:hypothetical protein